jgi:hypothetical protein
MPRPKQIRQAARRWFSPQATSYFVSVDLFDSVMNGFEILGILTTIVATMAAIRNARSICTLVNRINHLFLDPSRSSPVLSAQPTDPAGYSPPIPAKS